MPEPLKTQFVGWEEFSKISKKDQIPERFGPGIYMIAKFQTGLDKQSDPNGGLREEIIYIGKSASFMSDRLRDWYNSAFKRPEEVLVGGGVYRQLVKKEMIADNGDKDLYITVWRVEKEKGESDHDFEVRIMEVEYKLIFEYINKHKRFPLCNCELRKPIYHNGAWNLKWSLLKPSEKG